MADQYSIQDQNQFPALLGHSGTANNAETRRIVVTDAGAVSVDLVSGDTINIGTINVGSVAITSGTITSVSNLAKGTITRLEGGTVSTSQIPLSGVPKATSLAVGTTATAIPTTPLASRKSVIMYNSGTAVIYLGGTAVTTSSGLPVGTADYSPSIDLGTAVIYGRCSTAGGTIRILEVS